MGMNTGVSYDAQAKYSSCPLPVKKTHESVALIHRELFTIIERRGQVLLFGEISMGEGHMVPRCRESFLQLFGDHH